MVNNLGMLIGFVMSTLFYEKLGMTALCIMSVLSSVIGTILALNIKIIILKIPEKYQLKIFIYLQG